jgi:hypothetical protein
MPNSAPAAGFYVFDLPGCNLLELLTAQNLIHLVFEEVAAAKFW